MDRHREMDGQTYNPTNEHLCDYNTVLDIVLLATQKEKIFLQQTELLSFALLGTNISSNKLRQTDGQIDRGT